MLYPVAWYSDCNYHVEMMFNQLLKNFLQCIKVFCNWKEFFGAFIEGALLGILLVFIGLFFC